MGGVGAGALDGPVRQGGDRAMGVVGRVPDGNGCRRARGREPRAEIGSFWLTLIEPKMIA